MRKAVFFDLDGTLLPIDSSDFMKHYFKSIRKTILFSIISEENGEEIFGKAILKMVQNDGSKLNKDVFFDTIKELSGASAEMLLPYFDSFYHNEFRGLKKCTGVDKRVLKTVDILKDKGYRLILATNPVFPRIATDQRIKWAGFDPGDFEYISYYDNSRYCKPNPEYYREILIKTGLSAKECYMIGNDAGEDMSAVNLGFKGFLVLDHVMGDIEGAPECEQGDYSDLLEFARNLAI
jgi:FMN phosphatase YigB (HAD superfamily)